MKAEYCINIYRMLVVPDVRKPKSTKVEPSTVGILKLCRNDYPIFECYTIENGGESSKEANKDKRIMPGIYSLTWHATTCTVPEVDRQKKALYLLNSAVKGFNSRYILIHVGNYPQDTQGCILPNMDYNHKGVGSQSMKACTILFNLVRMIGVDKLKLNLYEEGSSMSQLAGADHPKFALYIKEHYGTPKLNTTDCFSR